MCRNHATSECENICNKDGCNDSVNSEMQDEKDCSNTHIRKDEARPVEWYHLHPALQGLLPPEKGLTYVTTEFTLPSEDFHGAHKNSFQATV